MAAKKEEDGGGGGGGRESPPPLTVDPTAPSGGQRSQGSSPAPGDATSTPKKASEEGGHSADESPPKYGSAGKIKASGIYYPLSAFPTSMPQGPVMSSPPTTVSNEGSANTSGRNLFPFICAATAAVKSCRKTRNRIVRIRLLIWVSRTLYETD